MKTKDIFGEKDICEIFGLDVEDIVRLCYRIVLEQVDETFHLISMKISKRVPPGLPGG